LKKAASKSEMSSLRKYPPAGKSCMDVRDVTTTSLKTTGQLTFVFLVSKRSAGIGDHPSLPEAQRSQSFEADVTPPPKRQLMPMMAMGLEGLVDPAGLSPTTGASLKDGMMR
jgi:hypothetical protein